LFLIDTDVISMTAPTKAHAPDEVLRWLKRHDDDLFLSTITLAEIRRGIAFVEAKGHSRKANALVEWENSLVQTFTDQILPLDNRVAKRAGDLLGLAEARGFAPGLPDACIAATADVHGLVLVTANGRHFQALNVQYRSPYLDEGRD
jgi:predicted nucleic acid-binding protein